MIELEVNGKKYQADVEPDASLLWVLRERLKLTGTKYVCGEGVCGSCTILVDGEAARSCQMTAADVEGKTVTTIEGIPEDHPVKKAWIAEQVPQCGYCQPGQVLVAAELLSKDPNPSDEAVEEAMDGVLCRCGTYPRIKRAIRLAVKEGGGK